MGTSILLTVALAAAPVELWFGGDVHLASGDAGVLDALAPATRGALGVVNFEGPVSTRPFVEGPTPLLFQHPNSPAVLAAAGVAVAGLANNHALDDGLEGRSRTREALRAASVLSAEPSSPARLVRGGLTIAVLAIDSSAGVPAGLAAQLAGARAPGEVLVVSLHTGGPPLFLPTPATREAVDAALKAGASVVAVHGNHSLGPVERRGDAVVLWGLGNLAFACRCTEEARALLVRVALTANGAGAATVIPVRAGLQGKPAALDPEVKDTLSLLKRLGSSALTPAALGASF